MNYYPRRIILYVETAKLILKCTTSPRQTNTKDSQDDLEEQS